jgi:hypothetical protein
MAYRPLCLLLAGLIGLTSFRAAAQESQFGRDTVADIRHRIELQHCDGAVADLKEGLKKGFVEVALLAGSMYDNGVCVKRDWNRAILFYVQAWQGGMKEAADRLAAGYAAPENGADVAAALWWSLRGSDGGARAKGMSACRVSPAAAEDMDRFVAELQGWPQARLAMCNYMVGVMATLSAEVGYPTLAAEYNVGGDVSLRFLPAVPQIDLRGGEVHEYAMYGLVNGDKARERASRSAGSFEKALREVADRALRRYPHPRGIPPDTLITTDWHFEVRYE